MKKVIDGFMDPKTDIDLADDLVEYSTVKIWDEAVLDYDIPVKVTVEIEEKYLSEALMDRLYKEGWTTTC